jgi:hypothetical protein
MSEQPQPTVWPALRYDDAPGAVRFLVDVFGFREAPVVPGDGGDVVHAESRWPEGGGVMLGSTKFTEGTHGEMKPGVNAVYVVTDDVDGVYARVRADRCPDRGRAAGHRLRLAHLHHQRSGGQSMDFRYLPWRVLKAGYCTFDEFFRPSVPEGLRSVSRVFLARWWCVAASRCAAAR